MQALLPLIWTTALGLVAASFVTLAALVVARVSREREERAEPERRTRISKALLHFAMTGGERPTFALSNAAERQIVVETALDAAQIMRGPAKERLVQMLREVGLDRRLRRSARHGRLRERLSALEALRLFPDARTMHTLHRAEQSRDLRVWLTALRTRVEIGAGPDMLGLLDFTARPGARRTPIMHDLIAQRAVENPPEALRVLAGSLPPAARILLIRGLGETGVQDALAPLRIALHDPDPAIRSAAAGALGALGYAAAGESLARALRDADWRVRLKACEAIGRLNLHAHAASLRPLLNDRVWWVRFRAEEALQHLSGAEAQTEFGATSAETKARA
jgi:hypothetical protein